MESCYRGCAPLSITNTLDMFLGYLLHLSKLSYFPAWRLGNGMERKTSPLVFELYIGRLL